MGILLTGRSSRLRINYRSTEEILRWSARVLEAEAVPGLSEDDTVSLAGYRSLLHGRRPDLRRFHHEDTELTALVEKIGDWVKSGVAPSKIAPRSPSPRASMPRSTRSKADWNTRA
ncbi:hypothetical protein [Streptomyces niveus]|uniref:hypothetical protein n=1 Tax=Streptomyces niveus TaxID=193462 RepID=UPI0036D3913E